MECLQVFEDKDVLVKGMSIHTDGFIVSRFEVHSSWLTKEWIYGGFANDYVVEQRYTFNGTTYSIHRDSICPAVLALHRQSMDDMQLKKLSDIN